MTNRNLSALGRLGLPRMLGTFVCWSELAKGKTRRMDAQRAVERVNKPGPKPEYGAALDSRLRKIKQRCKQRGVPFVITEYLKAEKVEEPA
jgi:hypothetical protein